MAAKTNIEDVTFLIPVRLDSVVRLENLLLVVEFLLSHFETHIHILEAAEYNNHFLERLLPQKVSFKFIEDYDPVFHRTKYINSLVEYCQTPLIAVWDTDVIVPPEQIFQSVECLRKKEAHFVYPYKDKFLDTSHILRELFLKKRDLKLLKKNTGKMTEQYLPTPVGGGFFASKSAYIKSGMENEHFYGWGMEDGDRFSRWKILGFQYKRISGPLFHFTHHRGENSSYHIPEQRKIKFSEIYRIMAMSKQELEEEIKTWHP